MMAEARRKQYVEVVATHYIDGSVRPQKIVLATGPVYEIEDSREAPCIKKNLPLGILSLKAR